MQYYLNDKKLNKIEKQKAEKDGLKIFEELDDYALKGCEIGGVKRTHNDVEER